MTLLRVLATALLMAFAAALLAEEPFEAILVVPDVRLLPGVPFDFWVELHNRSDSTRIISVCEPFHLRLVSGEPVYWTDTYEQAMARNHFSWSHGSEAVVSPGETEVLAIPAYSGAMAGGFFRQRPLSAPGRRFVIALPLCERTVPSDHRSPKSKLMSSEVEIEIMSPTGSDALVWNLIEERSEHQWTPADMASPEGNKIWETVLRDFPDSNYVPYATLMAGHHVLSDLRDRLAHQLRTIERFPDSPVLEWLHVETWQTARSLGLYGVMLAEGAKIRQSRRPTTPRLTSR